ncbi:hypothetical protein A2U01_0000986 [Trifolium medium]|uniref:C3H1-type domain-containing protein n=1 Tax=Trifolium medium TaxID=97028 RepID=A0A392LZ07_9FABA|nr:hypothetical protein [Trifolium medium]
MEHHLAAMPYRSYQSQLQQGIIGVPNVGHGIQIPHHAYQAQQQELIGVFTKRYNEMAAQQFVDCIRCNSTHLNFPSGDIPENYCVSCLVSTANLANGLLLQQSEILNRRTALFNRINQFPSHQVNKFKTEECTKVPKCVNGMDCMFLHPGEKFKNIHSTLMRGIIFPQAPPSFPLMQGIFTAHYIEVVPYQFADCYRCNPKPWVVTGNIVMPDNQCVLCLVNMSKWRAHLEAENVDLLHKNVEMEVMIRILEVYQEIKGKTKMCTIVDCADLKCPFAHDEAELVPIQPPFSQGLLGPVLQDI